MWYWILAIAAVLVGMFIAYRMASKEAAGQLSKLRESYAALQEMARKGIAEAWSEAGQEIAEIRTAAGKEIANASQRVFGLAAVEQLSKRLGDLVIRPEDLKLVLAVLGVLGYEVRVAEEARMVISQIDREIASKSDAIDQRAMQIRALQTLNLADIDGLESLVDDLDRLSAFAKLFEEDEILGDDAMPTPDFGEGVDHPLAV